MAERVRRWVRTGGVVPALAVAFAAKQLVAVWLIGAAAGDDLTRRMPVAVACASVLLAVALCQARGRRQAGAILAADVLLSVLFLADGLSFDQFGDVVSVGSLRYAHQLVDVSDAVWSLVRPVHALLFLDLPLLAWLLCRRGAAARLEPARGRGHAAVAVAAAALLVLVISTDQALGSQWEGFAHVARRAGPVAFHAMNATSYVHGRLRRPRGGEAETAAIRALLEARREAEARSAYRGALASRNVILVHVESLQSLVLGRRVEGVPVAPRLEALREESLSFEAFYHQAGEAHTADADVVANCSLYPLGHGSVYYEYPGNEFRCLPRLLAGHGYDTVAMQGIWADFWNLRTVYPRVGFSRFLARRDWNEDEILRMGISDRSFLRQAAEKLVRQREPFYSFVVTLTSHTPFTGAPSVLPLGKLAGTTMGDYLNSIHYTDAALGEFVDRLRASGVLDRSLLVIHGDHDGVGRYNVASAFEAAASDAPFWFELEHRVPLLIRFPHGAHAGRRHDPAGEVDVAPTIAGLLGVDRAEATFFGRDLFAAAEEPAVYFPDGAALDTSHLALPDGPGTRCFLRTSGALVPPQECAALAGRGARELSLSRQMLERDLAPRLAAAGAVRRGPGAGPLAAAAMP